MIYRFVVSHLAATTACLLLCASYLATRMVNIVLQSRRQPRIQNLAMRFFQAKAFWLVPIACFAFGGTLVVPSFLELVRTGATYEHWSRFIAMSVFFSIGFILIVTRVVGYTINWLAERDAYLRTQRP